MPTYEYQCAKCGHQMEAFQSMNDKPLTDCPNCKAASLTKLISAAGFQLKGSGWYVTDYSNKGKKNEGADKSTGSQTSTTDTSTKSSGGTAT